MRDNQVGRAGNERDLPCLSETDHEVGGYAGRVYHCKRRGYTLIVEGDFETARSLEDDYTKKGCEARERP